NEPSPLDIIGNAVVAAATAVATQLPGGAAPGPAQEGIAGAVPGAGSRAVTAVLDGAASGTVVLALAAPLAESLENGPIGPQDLAAALEPVLASALSALEPTFGSPLELHAAQAMDGELAMGSLRGAVIAVPLVLDGAVVASFSVAVDIDEEAESATPAGAGMDLPDFDRPQNRRRS